MKDNSESLTVQEQLDNLLDQLNEIKESLNNTSYYDEKFNNQLINIKNQYERINVPAREDRTKDIMTKIDDITTRYRELKNNIDNLPQKGFFQKLIDSWSTPTQTPQTSSVKTPKLRLTAEQIQQQRREQQLIEQQIQMCTNLANELQYTENLEQCNSAYITYNQRLIQMNTLESGMNEENKRQWITAKTTAHETIANTVSVFFNLSKQDIGEEIVVIKSNFNQITQDSTYYTPDTPSVSFDLRKLHPLFSVSLHKKNKEALSRDITRMMSLIEEHLLLDITTTNEEYVTFLNTSKTDLETLQSRLLQIEQADDIITQKVARKSELDQGDEHSFNSLMASINNALLIDNVSLKYIQTERTLEHTTLSEKVSGFINGTNDETVVTLKEAARLLLDRVTQENNRIAMLSRKPSNTQPSFLEALNELRTKSRDLKQRDNGAENSLEWDAHLQLETLIAGLTCAEQTYITAVADPVVVAPVVENHAEPVVEIPAEPVAEPAVESTTEPAAKTALEIFQETCNELINNLDKTIINQNRGWSIARVLDNITSAIDALIDVVYQNAPNTTKTVYNFFHHSPTTKTQVDNLEEAVRTFGTPAA